MNDALKVSKVLALKALACITPHAEKIFSILCEKEVGDEMNERFFFKERPELLSLKYSYQQAENSMQKRKVLSIFALQHSLKAMRKATGIHIPKELYTEARLHAKCFGPGSDPPAVQPKTLCFTEKQLKTVVEFVLNPEQSSGLAWGEKLFTTTEGKKHTIPNFQRKADPEQLWKKFEKVQKQKEDVRHIKRATFLEITNVITNSQSTSLAALDNIAVRFGTENFQNIRKFVTAELLYTCFCFVLRKIKCFSFQYYKRSHEKSLFSWPTDVPLSPKRMYDQLQFFSAVSR